MQARNRALPVIATAITLTLGGAAVAGATPTSRVAMDGATTHMGQFDVETLEEMTDLMDSGASVGRMHRWMADQGIQLGPVHGDMAAEGMAPGTMHRYMARR